MNEYIKMEFRELRQKLLSGEWKIAVDDEGCYYKWFDFIGAVVCTESDDPIDWNRVYCDGLEEFEVKEFEGVCYGLSDQ